MEGGGRGGIEERGRVHGGEGDGEDLTQHKIHYE